MHPSMEEDLGNASQINMDVVHPDVTPKREMESTLVEELLRQRRLDCDNATDSEHDLQALHCPHIFDGWSCWNATPAGHKAHVQCPFFISGFDPTRTAHKTCTEDGTWFRHPESNQTWSNYTTCVDMEDLELRQVVITIHIAGYSLSLAALLISLVIFVYFKSLKCTRIEIHKNLFVSLIVNNAIWLIWYREVVDKPHVIITNGIGCQVLHVILQYFLVCTYFWMFCEGLYLHTILVVAFVSEDKIMKVLYVIGWGIPALLAAVYASLRAYSTAYAQQ